MNGKFPFAWDPQCLRNSKENGTSNRAFDEAFARQDGAKAHRTYKSKTRTFQYGMQCGQRCSTSLLNHRSDFGQYLEVTLDCGQVSTDR